MMITKQKTAARYEIINIDSKQEMEHVNPYNSEEHTKRAIEKDKRNANFQKNGVAEEELMKRHIRLNHLQ